MSKKIETIVNNKKAYFNYEIGETFVAGLRILGTEIKSVREGSCSIKESFCIINDGEIYVTNMYIKEYKFGEKHDETRERKLLLTKQEIKKITKKIEEKGYSLIPIKLLIVNNWAKLEIGVGKGKKLYDKKDSIKSKDIDRQAERDIKHN